ncbi:hypothetical protein B0H63DRAFT_412574 [Podospora didyma]|uniref:Uncharacterized protein n=1 Tax=Podospora didyma TaxID=330526 RepID=A0AAE0NTS5_9PEZI|nr:hypothetical protein B0H63DRAFT_412574 [Podospora didyma]
MDFIKKIAGGSHSNAANATGGGPESERNEDFLDKGVDIVQERVFKQGAQNNETAQEQAKDEKISDGIRKGYKAVFKKDVPIQDK